jgi:Type VI secretion system VasI, EvfG, VC_A0118
MMSQRLIVIAALVAGSTGGACAADRFDIGLELCIQAAREADATCARLTDDPAQRLECFQKARGSQLDCLEHALADTTTAAAPLDSHSGASQADTPTSAVSPEARPPAAASQEAAHSHSQGASQGSSEPTSTASTSPKEPASSAQATPEAMPSPLPSTESATAAVQSDPPKSDSSKAEASKANSAETSAPRVRPPQSSWLVSETTSPVDYGPLLTAVIRPTSGSPGGPVSLAIRCRGGQTALLIRTEGTWHAARRNALPVDFKINDQTAVRQNWTLSADAKIANYADDPVELLRSLPDGARLSVSVPDGADAQQQATFLLAGWDAIRKRVETACKWPKTTTEASSGKR